MLVLYFLTEVLDEVQHSLAEILYIGLNIATISIPANHSLAEIATSAEEY